MNAIDSLKIILVISLFFSFGINVINYTLPADAKNYILDSTAQANTYDMTDTKEQVEGSYNKIHTGIPLIDVAGSLVFFSGQIFLDLIMNFILAIPSLLTLIISNVFFFVDSGIMKFVNIFIYAVFSVIYVINLIVMAINAFSQAGVSVT